MKVRLQRMASIREVMYWGSVLLPHKHLHNDKVGVQQVQDGLALFNIYIPEAVLQYFTGVTQRTKGATHTFQPEVRVAAHSHWHPDNNGRHVQRQPHVRTDSSLA